MVWGSSGEITSLGLKQFPDWRLSLGITRSLMPSKRTAGKYVCTRNGNKKCPDVFK